MRSMTLEFNVDRDHSLASLGGGETTGASATVVVLFALKP